MTNKKYNKWRTIVLEESVKLQLKKMKIYPKESYQDIIKRLMRNVL